MVAVVRGGAGPAPAPHNVYNGPGSVKDNCRMVTSRAEKLPVLGPTPFFFLQIVIPVLEARCDVCEDEPSCSVVLICSAHSLN